MLAIIIILQVQKIEAITNITIFSIIKFKSKVTSKANTTMNSFCGAQIVPPTQKAAKYVLIFKILMVFQFMIAVIDIVAHKSFLREGLFGLFFLFLLFQAYYKLSYHSVLIYTFLSIFFSVVFLVYILTIIQRGNTIEDFEDVWAKYYLAVACVSFVFYLINSVFCFFPYRQFKSIEYLDNPVFSQMMIDSAAQPNPEQMIENPVKYTLDYGTSAPKEQKKPKGTFQVFKGQGVRIG